MLREPRTAVVPRWAWNLFCSCILLVSGVDREQPQLPQSNSRQPINLVIAENAFHEKRTAPYTVPEVLSRDLLSGVACDRSWTLTLLSRHGDQPR
jgi:hypothetical protein